MHAEGEVDWWNQVTMPAPYQEQGRGDYEKRLSKTHHLGKPKIRKSLAEEKYVWYFQCNRGATQQTKINTGHKDNQIR